MSQKLSLASRDGAGPAGNGGGLLRMKQLAEASGVPAPTIKHYLREGLLPEPVKTSRNMAYYPQEFVERIRLIELHHHLSRRNEVGGERLVEVEDRLDAAVVFIVEGAPFSSAA